MLYFLDGSFAKSGESTLRVELLPGEKSKEQIFFEVARGTRHQFQIDNWDALSDVLRSMEWLPHTNITLIHPSYPVLSNNEDNEQYVDVIGAALESWAANPNFIHWSEGGISRSLERQLNAYFPRESEESIACIFEKRILRKLST